MVVAPSVVSDRYVQLTDLSRGGPRLADGAVIPESRTATPVELDELYASLDTLVTALGPDGANNEGALSELLDTGAANLRRQRQGVQRHRAQLRQGRADAVRLGRRPVRHGRRAAELHHHARRQRRAGARREHPARPGVAHAGRRPRRAVAPRCARSRARSPTSRASSRTTAPPSSPMWTSWRATTQLLVDNRASVAEALDVAPLAVTNVVNAFDPASQTLQGRANLLEYLKDPPPTAGAVHRRRDAGGWPMIRRVPRLPSRPPCSPPAAPPSGDERHLRHAAARRRGPRRPPVPGHRASSPTCSTSCRRPR